MATDTRFTTHRRQLSLLSEESVAKRPFLIRRDDNKPRTLMTLPAEVRLHILKRALWQAEPLRVFSTEEVLAGETPNKAKTVQNFSLHIQLL